jgi:hypothetical protein
MTARSKFITLATGQTWVEPNGASRTIVDLHPETDTAEASVRFRIAGRVVTITVVTFRTWISRTKAVVFKVGNSE